MTDARGGAGGQVPALLQPVARDQHLAALDGILLFDLARERLSADELLARARHGFPSLADEHLLWRWFMYSHKRRLVEPSEEGALSFETPWDVTEQGTERLDEAGDPKFDWKWVVGTVLAVCVVIGAASTAPDAKQLVPVLAVLILLGIWVGWWAYKRFGSRRVDRLLVKSALEQEHRVQAAIEQHPEVEPWWPPPAEPA